VPDAPTHASRGGAKDATVHAAGDEVTGQVRDEDPQEVQAR
jgi:hypothetical protein